MKSGHMMAAAVLAGAMVVGCDKKSDSTETPATPPATPSMTTPAVPDKSATDSAMQNAGDKMKAMGDQAKDAGAKAMDAVNTEKDKIKDKMSATSMPSMPSMPSMK